MNESCFNNNNKKNDTKFDEIFGKCVFREFNFKFRAKMETYNVREEIEMTKCVLL